MGFLWNKLVESLSPQQVCWLCLLLTAMGALYGVRTFAKDSEVKEIRIELLQQRLVDLRIRQCDSIKEGQPSVFFAREMTSLMDKYYLLTGRSAILPMCAEL
jgi:hypothetical protein